MQFRWLLVMLALLVVASAGCSGEADCSADQLACGGSCIDPLNNNQNCGACGAACSDGLVCGNGTCGDRCPLGQAVCDATCVYTDTDAANCGGCGTACAGSDVCTDGICHEPCDPAMLTSSITDPWGVVWDGLERPAAALDAATATCAAFGATLPTATELHRVSATQSGAVGQSFHTNFLWSRAPNDRLDQATVRLSDGGTSSAPAASAQPYRCTCPAVKPRYFKGNHCNGPAGSACFAHANYNIDKVDRPALRKSAAVWECTNERAHLADLPILAAAIRAGLPGSNAFLSTADAYRYDMTTQVRWSSQAWELAGNLDGVLLTTPAPFRCAGPAFASSFNATPIPGAFLPKLGMYKAESADFAATGWAEAQDQCWLRGGHLPRASDLAELIGQGLPGGSGAFLWSSDEVGWNGPVMNNNFLAAVVRWTGLDQRYPYEYTPGSDSSATWVYKTDVRPFRCIYYPLDPDFTPPASCNGGCSVRSAGSPAATISFDLQDRPAATIAAAIADCAATGGHLASERDYTEAVRGGLANGSGAYLLTWDIGVGCGNVTPCPAPNALPPGNLMVVKWTNTDKAFTDQWLPGAEPPGKYMTWADVAMPRPYRCMWTNEVR